MSRSEVVRRISIAMTVGVLIGAAISEVAFFFVQEDARPPQAIDLVIPAGAAERVRQGEQPPSIPDTLSFVRGDTLVVKNEDTVDHQLGPLWIPAGATASLLLSSVDSYAYTCSFRADKYLGLDVHEPLTLGTRLGGMLFSGIPLGILLALYGLLLSPKRSVLNQGK